MAAEVCTLFRRPSSSVRSDEISPSLMVSSSPSGLPIAYTFWPVTSALPGARVTGG